MEENAMRKRLGNSGFTLVEIMIVTAIIGLLAGIAVPSFAKSRTAVRTQSCKNNLRQMDAAKQLAAMDYSWGETDGPDSIGNPYYRNTCSTYLSRGVRPVCPTGAECYYKALNESATCTSGIASHTLP